MAQTKFDKQVEKDAESLVFGISRVLAYRDLDGVKRTDATFWHAGTRVLPKVEGKVRRRSYKPGWRRLSFRLALGAGVAETGYLSTRDLDATQETLTELWENREATLATLETGGIGAASVLTVGSAAYLVLTRERRELMREWVGPLHDALHRPLGLAEQTEPRRYLHIPKNFSDDDAEIRIDLPRHLGFSREVVADLITQKLALEGVTFSWHPEGRKPYVLVKKTRKPPTKSVFKDPKTRELVAKAKESAPIIGFGAAWADRLRRPGRRIPAHPGQRLHRRRQVGDPALHRLPDAPPRQPRLRPRHQADLPPVGARRHQRHLLRRHRRHPRPAHRARHGRPHAAPGSPTNWASAPTRKPSARGC